MKKESAKGKVLAKIQHLEDAVIDRFCSVKRRIRSETVWMDDNTSFSELEPLILERVLFYEERGYYLFQEPFIEHEPMKHRFRAVLTFRPTEKNR